ncbi:MAG: hypothetical protein COA82_09465 [Alkaliphilus sp.]|nr:MAG: hypothetical protein COA82_09465 [Alkaliphilus sp.]
MKLKHKIPLIITIAAIMIFAFLWLLLLNFNKNTILPYVRSNAIDKINAEVDTGATKAYPRLHCTWLDAAARRFLRPTQPPTTVPLLQTGPPGRAT